MLQVARLAPNVLQEATDRVAGFLLDQFGDDGGARDRAGASDLYYTVFALDGLIALRVDPPLDRVSKYVDGFGDGEGLDLVHLACLARCRAALSQAESEGPGLGDRSAAIADRVLSHRSPDGGFAPNGERGTVYDAFLAVGALEDLGYPLDSRAATEVCEAVRSLALPEGAFPKRADAPVGTTPTTAAGVTLLRHLAGSAEVPPAAAAWLRSRVHPEGGFAATEGAPMPDLLSTATALHALVGMNASIEDLAERSLDFLDSLWTGRSFCGSWADDTLDAEYAFYALLALGHLSLA